MSRFFLAIVACVVTPLLQGQWTLPNYQVVDAESLSRFPRSVVIQNGYIHTSSGSGAASINIGTGLVSEAQSYVPGLLRLQPGGKYIYAGNSSVYKYDGARVPLVSLYSVDLNNCYASQFWFSEGGYRLLTSCGTVQRLSEVQAEDLSYRGRLAGSQ